MKLLDIFRTKPQESRLDHEVEKLSRLTKAIHHEDLEQLLDLKQSGFGRKGADPHHGHY